MLVCDGDGKRRSYEDSVQPRNFIWDGQNISYQTGSDGSLNRTYTYRPSMYACPERSRGRELISQTREYHHGVYPGRSPRDGLDLASAESTSDRSVRWAQRCFYAREAGKTDCRSLTWNGRRSGSGRSPSAALRTSRLLPNGHD